jgi:hypothetical protein
MGIDGVAGNVIDQVGLEDHGLISDVDRKKAETSGEDLIELLGVLLGMENRNSGPTRSSVRMIFGQKKGSFNRRASRHRRAPNKKISASNAHTITPKADKPQRYSRARQVNASVLVSSMLGRSGRAASELQSDAIGRRCAAKARIAHARLHGAVRVDATRSK